MGHGYPDLAAAIARKRACERTPRAFWRAIARTHRSGAVPRGHQGATHQGGSHGDSQNSPLRLRCAGGGRDRRCGRHGLRGRRCLRRQAGTTGSEMGSPGAADLPTNRRRRVRASRLRALGRRLALPAWVDRLGCPARVVALAISARLPDRRQGPASRSPCSRSRGIPLRPFVGRSSRSLKWWSSRRNRPNPLRRRSRRLSKWLWSNVSKNPNTRPRTQPANTAYPEFSEGSGLSRG